jgi:hypothetical protein|tara:strand:+ start:1424 stop:1684 length:261 start_codon:yes stop_codon:yes gene_type:complete
MWLWIVSNVAGSLLGAASTKWFKDTRAGVWCYDRFDDIAEWATKRYGIDILDKEGIAWRAKYPNVAKEIDSLRKDIDALAERLKDK